MKVQSVALGVLLSLSPSLGFVSQFVSPFFAAGANRRSVARKYASSDFNYGGNHINSGLDSLSVTELKRLLAGRQADLARNLTERLMAYALGRHLEGYDEVVIDRLMARISEDDYRVRTIISEVIGSYLFTHRRVEE